MRWYLKSAKNQKLYKDTNRGERIDLVYEHVEKVPGVMVQNYLLLCNLLVKFCFYPWWKLPEKEAISNGLLIGQEYRISQECIEGP
jgi:hypothetical protein